MQSGNPIVSSAIDVQLLMMNLHHVMYFELMEEV
jgi:hypothetical protein